MGYGGRPNRRLGITPAALLDMRGTLCGGFRRRGDPTRLAATRGVLGRPAPFRPVPGLQKAQVWVFSTEQRRRAQLFLVINRGQQSEMRPKGEVSMFEATLPLLIPLAAYLCAAVAAVIEHGRNRNCLGGAR